MPPLEKRIQQTIVVLVHGHGFKIPQPSGVAETGAEDGVAFR